MFRTLIRKFQNVLIIQQRQITKTTTACNRLQLTLFQLEKAPTNGNAITVSAPENDDAVANISSSTTETDTDYIVPYRFEDEFHTPMNTLYEIIKTRFRLTQTDLKEIMNDECVNRTYRHRSLQRSFEYLCEVGISKKSFVAHPWLMTLDKKRLEDKITLIKTMPVRDINHFAPMLRLTVTRLRKVVQSLNREKNLVPYGNRVYYISEKLHVDADVVTKYLAKRLFVLEMQFEMFAKKLQFMIDYEVSPQNILRDLWAFRYTPKSIQLRLERAKRARKEKIMPWMVRCPESILQRSLKISMDEQAVLGENASIVEYLAERLQFDTTQTKAIMSKHPQVQTVRVTKVKEVLDYLLNEAGFNRYEIAQVPRILCHSLKTTKKRLEELSSYGCRPTSLVIVCRSKREYEKFLQYWLNIKGLDYKQN